MEEKRGMTIKDLLIRLILIVIFVFLLIWLFPMPDLKPLNNQIFADNIDRMKDVAKSYYTVERLPKELNESKRMTLKEMIDQHLILPLMDSNGKYCSEDDSYIEITKAQDEYVIKVYLSCTDKQDYIITHFGCYDICSDTCKALETTTQNCGGNVCNTQGGGKVTTKNNNGKIFEYKYVRNVCTQDFAGYFCPSGYYLAGDVCIKNGSQTITVDADKHVSNITSTDTKDAKAIVDSSTELVDATCKNEIQTSTIDANKSSVLVNATLKIKNQTVTADKINSYDVKGAVIKRKTINSDYILTQKYDVITATKYATGYKWAYASTITTTDSSLSYVGENEKILLVDTYELPTCDTCVTTVKYYKYYKYTKQATGYSYSCDAFPGYTKYGEDKCRKPIGSPVKACPDGYNPNGSVCTRVEETMSCDKYGSGYVLNESAKTCTKTTTTYRCPEGTSKTNDERYCTKPVKSYECPPGTYETADETKCSKTSYSCPPNTSDKTYVLNGTKCTVQSKVKVCTCPPGTDKTADETKCAKKNTTTRYSCEDYPGYTLNGTKCTKTTTTQKVTYSCDAGYNLTGTKCIKTVDTTDTKKAEKKYNTTCNNEYIWSTRTSINGWTFTGEKREIY